jgi:Ca2+/H+ antiporter, TMEM165/GDT1 family
MMINPTHASATGLAAFLASTVEFVEALTVVLAVGGVRGWRDTLFGAAAAAGVLALLTAVLGPALTFIPLRVLQVGVGALLILFGLRWLRKAILRSAGVLALHDEDQAFKKNREAMLQLGAKGAGFDAIAFGAAFQICMLEGTEVVFIVIAVSAGGVGLIVPASLGALAAFVLVAALGLVLHKPMSRVPENTLKFIVGVILSGFGAFWVGEGIGVAWPGNDLSILALVVGFGALGLVAVPLCRARARTAAGARA